MVDYTATKVVVPRIEDSVTEKKRRNGPAPSSAAASQRFVKETYKL